jgi:hypothetical protein
VADAAIRLRIEDKTMITQCVQPVGSSWAARYLMGLLLMGLLTVGAPSVAHALIVNTTDTGVVSTFQTGAAIETFDDLAGLVITSYASVAVPAANQFSGRDLTDPSLPAFNSGGATFTDPASNPGTLIGIFDPEDPIDADFQSPNNVAGPLEVNTDQAFGAGFMEVIFQDPVSKVGFWVTHGTITLILKDTSNNNLASGDFTVTGTEGNFIGIDRGVSDVGGITLIGGPDSFTLDDFTSGGATTTVPEPATLVLLATGLAGFGAMRWRRQSDM